MKKEFVLKRRSEYSILILDNVTSAFCENQEFLYDSFRDPFGAQSCSAAPPYQEESAKVARHHYQMLPGRLTSTSLNSLI